MSELTASEIEKLRTLLEVESIRETRLLYSHYMDTGAIDALADLFTEDAVCEFGPFGTWSTRDTIRANYHKVEGELGPFFAMHATCDHLVRLTGPDTAVGRAYLLEPSTTRKADETPFIYLGLYDEDYRKVDDRWQIARSRLQFFWPDRNVSDGFPEKFPYAP